MRGIDHYALLGVRNDASVREIRRAYRRLARQHHPDLNPRPDGPERFAELARAYAVLNHPVERARYDQTLLERSAPARRATALRASVVRRTVQRGIIELSPNEAQHLARHALTLRDGRGRTIVLPAGTGHGDEISLLYDNRRVVLAVHARTKT
jgi:curved DNA-binding protein CbpA